MSFLRKIWSFLVDTVQTFLVAAFVILVIYMFFFRPFQVNGASMYPNFMDQEYVLTNLIFLHFQDPKRGEVMVFNAPPDREKDFIKRVIGLPGEKIMLKEGDVYINGKRLDESAYLKSDVKTYGRTFLRDNQEITVPSGDYFVLGDNRLYSSDSREWGYIKKSDVIGESFFIYWPLNMAKFIKNPYQ